MCIQTQDINDLYWNINQIDLSGRVTKTDNSAIITMTHNVPNFDSYLLRINNESEWRRVTEDEINLELREEGTIVEVKAKNGFGGETPTILYRIVRRNDDLQIVPGGKKIIRGRYDFRFETSESPKVEWLRHYALPVVENIEDQWNKYLALKRWVREQIPFKDPVVESHWDTQRVLQAVWSDHKVGFVCDAYAATYTSACISVGLNARMMHLESVEGNGHYATEVWSDDYNKWIFMDPLIGCYFTMNGEPLSTMELHNLWKDKRWNKAEKKSEKEILAIHLDISEREYFKLFHDIQLINSNDFLTSPFTSVFDLLTLKVRYIRWVDEINPEYNRVLLAIKLILFYYLPKLSKVFIIPFLIPFLLLLISMLLIKEVYKRPAVPFQK